MMPQTGGLGDHRCTGWRQAAVELVKVRDRAKKA
jgi:hypothetical protein